MRARSRVSLWCAVMLLAWSVPASAQYLKITTDNPGDNTRMRVAGTTLLTVTLDTNHDRNGALQSCNSHTAACGAPTTAQPLDMFGYTLALKAIGGTVSWGTFTPADAAYTDSQAPFSNLTEIEINQFRPTGTTTPPGLVTIGTLPVTILSGAPAIGLQVGPGALNPFGFGTGFATDCDGFFFANFYVVGDPADPCGTTSGTPGDWFDWDGAGPPAAADSPPVLNAIANMSIAQGGCAPSTADQAISATDPDGNAITFSFSGPSWMTVTSNSQAGNTRTGNIHLVSPPNGTPSQNASVTATANGLSDTKTFFIQVVQVNQAPTLNQPSNMSVATGSTADQAISGSDPCGQPLTFSKVSGPAFMTVTTTSPTTGNIHLAPLIGPTGTFAATVQVSNGTLTNQKSFTITQSGERAPVLDPIANMLVPEGGTRDQTITAHDPDGNSLNFSKVSGPTYMTVTTTSPGTGTATGNIHLAPGFTDAGTAGGSVQVSDGSLTDTKSFTITVCNGCARAPVMAPISDMTVTEGMTADQPISATDPDGDALNFLKTAGPIFMTVTTTDPGAGSATGNIHLAPGLADAGTYSAIASVSDGALSGSRTFGITVTTSGNRCPVSNPGGPYSGLAGVPVAFDGSASTDPDGNPLTYDWDFDASNGITVDATGAMVNHTYAAGGAFTVTLTVTDNGDGDPAQICSNSATTTASITAACGATIFNGYDTIRLGSGKPFWFGYVQPSTGCYANSDVIVSSFVMKYAGRQISASGKTSVGGDKSGDGIAEIKINFAKDDLRALFSGTGLPNGHSNVTVTLEANLVTGGILRGTTTLDVVNNGNFTAATVAPNPLNPEATLTYTTTRTGPVRIDLFDIQGRLVRRIVDESSLAAGTHQATIHGEKLASGVYYIRGTSSEGEFRKLITILK